MAAPTAAQAMGSLQAMPQHPSPPGKGKVPGPKAAKKAKGSGKKKSAKKAGKKRPIRPDVNPYA